MLSPFAARRWILGLALIAGLVIPLAAVPTTPGWAAPTAAAPETSSEAGAMAAARRSGHGVEVASLTTGRQRVVADPATGRFVAEVNANPVRRRVGTAWVGLDSTLARSGGTAAPRAALLRCLG